MSRLLRDKELNQYRDLVKPPGHFDEGFNWKTVLGTVFVGLVMLPASMYMHLMIGEASLGPAAQWVTVILFLEMAKRARSFLKPAEIFILMGMIMTFVGTTPVEGFFWRQYLVQSDAVRSFGLSGEFPSWFAPQDQAVLDQRTFFHTAWIVPLLILFTNMVVNKIDSLILGYGLFRVASDVEKLPFPMAPMRAVGILALADSASGREGWRWRCFSIAAAMGMVFGLVYIGIPTITSTFLDEPFMIFPIPWLDTTVATQDWFPATATGISFDLSNFFLGMALPFFAVLGSFIGVMVTVILNPYLYDWGVLTTWQKGETTVETIFANNVDFYLSFGIGLSVAVALIGIYQTVASLRARRLVASLDDAVPDGGRSPTPARGVARGDIRTAVVILTYVVSSAFYIVLCGFLLDWDFQGTWLLWIFIFFALVYVPFISYVTARLEGLAGQVLQLPMIKEAAFILSGYRGLDIWLLPLPLTANYGDDTVQYRVAELVGCSFRSIWKLFAFALPLVFIFSLLYGEFIWQMAPIPSSDYPYAMEVWDLHARNQVIVYTSTAQGYSPFMEALKWEYIAAGSLLGLLTYMGLAAFGLPVLLLYGTVKGLGQSIPQFVATQMLGALFGRYVMAPRFGADRWRQYSLVLFAGFTCGAGLVMMLSTGVKFLQSSVFQAPF